MKSKLFRVLICGMVLLSLAACTPAEGDAAGDAVPTVAVLPTPTATPVPTPEPTPDPWAGASYAPDGTLISHSSITHTAEVVEKEGLLPYVLYTPSTAAELEKVPLIVWLH